MVIFLARKLANLGGLTRCEETPEISGAELYNCQKASGKERKRWKKWERETGPGVSFIAIGGHNRSLFYYLVKQKRFTVSVLLRSCHGDFFTFKREQTETENERERESRKRFIPGSNDFEVFMDPALYFVINNFSCVSYSRCDLIVFLEIFYTVHFNRYRNTSSKITSEVNFLDW